MYDLGLIGKHVEELKEAFKEASTLYIENPTQKNYEALIYEALRPYGVIQMLMQMATETVAVKPEESIKIVKG